MTARSLLGPLWFGKIASAGGTVGLVLGFTGAGGSILSVPILVYLLRREAHEAICISMAIVAVLALIEVFRAWFEHDFVKSTGWSAVAGGIFGAPLGAWLNQLLSSKYLLLVLALCGFWIGARMLFLVSNPDDQLKRDGKYFKQAGKSFTILLLGVLAGFLSGFLGISGGFFLIPAFVSFLGMSMPQAIRAALVIVSGTALVGLASHLWFGQRIPVRFSTVYIFGGILGFLLGENLRVRIAPGVLQKVFGVLILGISIFMGLEKMREVFR